MSRASNLLQRDFGLTLKRSGMGSDVVAETALEVRSLLGQSLSAAQSKLWRKAEQLRLDAYINFDLEIESRMLPRDPALAIRAEKAFLDGQSGEPGVKAALDARLTGEELTAAYQRALDALEECTALVKVGSFAHRRGDWRDFHRREGRFGGGGYSGRPAGRAARRRKREDSQAYRRRRMAGAGCHGSDLCGLAHAFAGTFPLRGRRLEAVISVVAVIVLLIVTNWVFHKYYWTGWNARLRELSKAAQRQQQTRWEGLALVGVGFVTIFREGFETTLFMQSLILEAGMRPVLLGLAIGGLFIGVVGIAVFSIGAKLPYRKMLVITGGLVIFVCLRLSDRRSGYSRRSAGCRFIRFRAWNCRPGWEFGWDCIRPGRDC